jgi:hypothetical protein
MEEPAEDPIGPFFGLPPFTALPFFFIGWNSIVRNAEIHDLEEQSTPGHKTLRTLLIPGQVQNDRVFVRLEDKMQDCRDVLLGTGRWRVEQISGKRDEGRKRLLNNAGQNFALLAETIQPVRVGTMLGEEETRAYRNARTISSTTTVPAPTSRMLLLARSALAPPSSSGHLSGKSCEMSVLSVLASWTVITRDGDPESNGRILLFRAARSEGEIAL